MSVITRHLPWFIRDPAISIIGQKCYTSLVENLDVTNVECLKYSFSKALGIGIVVFGSVVKVPQLILILRARSARGVSLPAYVLETLAYAITLAYSARNAFPFSTYGENLFLTIQNIMVTLLIIHHSPSSKQSSNKPQLVSAIVLACMTVYGLAIIPSNGLTILQMSTIPLSLLSKLPQIYENQRAQSTGQLSSVAVLSQIAGCLARLFTTATEVGDSILFAGFLFALILNLVLGAQMYVFWGREAEDKALGKRPASEKGNLETIVVPPQSPLYPQGGRRWARKID